MSLLGSSQLGYSYDHNVLEVCYCRRYAVITMYREYVYVVAEGVPS